MTRKVGPGRSVISVSASDLTGAEDRFWGKVEVLSEDECWPWLGGTKPGGYGMFWLAGKLVVATRLAWSLRYRVPFPDDLYACHTCDNPNCVNPKHIWPGTPQHNALDATIKGRMTAPKTIPHNTLKTHCIRGHEFTPENTIAAAPGQRACRICRRMHQREWDRKNRQAKRAAARAQSKPSDDLSGVGR
jgi:hypothetical protein